VDRDVVARKLEQLRHHVARIESKKPLDAAGLAGDEDLRDIVVFNLVQAVEVCVDVGMHIVSDTNLKPPESMGEVFDRLHKLGVLGAEPDGGELAQRLRQAVGLRNVAVHGYAELDFDMVDQACGQGLDDLRQFASSIESAYLK